MTAPEATALAAYCRRQCWWLEVAVRPDAQARRWAVLLRLAWPKGQAETLTEYRTGPADAAIDRLCARSERYWEGVTGSRRARALV